MTRGSKAKSGREIHVLLVSDSAPVRQAMAALLAHDKELRLTTVADPLIGLAQFRRDRPHAMILDLDTPSIDGLAFLRSVMKDAPVPVIACSGASPAGSAKAIEALEAGAVDILARPVLRGGAWDEQQAILIADVLRGAASVRVERDIAAAMGSAPVGVPTVRSRLSARTATRADPLIVIGASIGGPAALARLVQGLPSDLPGIVAVQHMPEGFTPAFAARLNRLGAIRVRQAEPGDPVIRGQMLIAPPDRHARIRRSGPGFVVDLAEGPLVSRHCPSIDVLFDSAACEAGPHALGVLLTGIGNDGAIGLLRMRRAGAMTLAQDDATSLVPDLPRAAATVGAVDEGLALPAIEAAIVSRVEELLTRLE